MRKGWENKKLGEVCTLISDGSHNPPKGIDHSLYRMISSQNVFDDNLQITEDNVRYITESDHLCENKRTKLQKDVVLLTIVGTIGRSCVLKGDEGCLTLQRSVAALHPSDQIMPRYLMHCLIGNRHTLNQEAHGIAQKGIYLKQLSSLSIPLPPKSTQLAIVSELDKINELIRLKKEQLKDFDNLAQSLFYEMFGDPVENEKGWEVKKLKDISREIGDGLHGTPEYSEVDTGCYFINGNNLENGTIVIKENTKMVSEKTKAKHYIEMDDFTILVSINGTLGKVAFYNGENVILGKSACYIKLEAYNDKKYIFELLKSDYFKRYAESECTGTTIRNVSLKSMRNFRCPLPPLPLQRLFAQRIEQIEREKSEVQKSIQDLETLLASRMQYWFE